MRKNQTKKYDVIVVGAGPAGLAAAKYLAENKKKVLVLEKNKVIGPKVCAGGLTTKDFSLGIDKKLAEKFFSKVLLHTPLFNDEVCDKKPFVATVDRRRLGQFMAKQAKLAGAEIKVNTAVEEIKDNFVLANGKKYYYNYLIGADGSNSVVRKYLGIITESQLVAFHYKVPDKFPDLELFFNAELFGGGYAWIFPHNKFTSVGCGADVRFLLNSEQLQKNFEKWIREKYPKIKLDKNDYEAWSINYDYKGHEFGNKYLVGDAAGFGSGLTGEGMYFAMVSGIENAKKIIDRNYEQPKIKEILAIKAEHERVLGLITKNEVLSQVEYNLLGLAQKCRLLDDKLIGSFC